MDGSFKNIEKNFFKIVRIVVLSLLVFFIFKLVMEFWDVVFIVIFFIILVLSNVGFVVLFCFFKRVVEKFDVYICLIMYIS